MLSDRDARRLAELETSLLRDDPEFAERLGAGWQEAHRRPLPPWVLWAYLPVMVLALVLPDPVPVVTALGLTCAAAHACRPTASRSGAAPRRRAP